MISRKRVSNTESDCIFPDGSAFGGQGTGKLQNRGQMMQGIWTRNTDATGPVGDTYSPRCGGHGTTPRGYKKGGCLSSVALLGNSLSKGPM